MIGPALSSNQNIWADLPKNQRDARYPIPGEQQKEIAKWLAESESAFLLVETSLVPPLKCCALIRQTGRTGHQTVDWLIAAIVTIADPSSSDGVDWALDGRLLEISCLRAEAHEVVWSLLPRVGSQQMYEWPQLSHQQDAAGNNDSIRLATRGARFLQLARERAIAAALAGGGR